MFERSEYATQFHQTYYLQLMREIFVVMTGALLPGHAEDARSIVLHCSAYCCTIDMLLHAATLPESLL